jgi:hypothetical protein
MPESSSGWSVSMLSGLRVREQLAQLRPSPADPER